MTDQIFHLKEHMVPCRFGHSWKVDRSGLCTLPANVVFDPNEPCGADYAKSYKAKAACQSLIGNDNHTFFRGKNEI